MYSYQKCIELGKQDLIKYPKEQLYQLGGVMGLPLNVGHSVLAENIAVKLIDKHWVPQYGNMTREELPYGGSMLDAIRAEDRPAIRQIREWLDVQESERRSQQVAEAAERQVPEEAADCENPIDYITQEVWSADNPPEVKITLWDIKDPINGPRRTICFKREELQQWIADQSHRMAPWIPNLLGGVIDNDGHGGGPSVQIFTQLPERTLVFGGPEFNEDNWIGIPTATDVRIGNRAGVMGVSALHGQVPGKVVYTVFPQELSNYQEIFRDNFVGDLQSRMMDGGIMLLGQILTGEKKARFDELFNENIADSIVFEDTLDWDRFVDFTGNDKFIALSRFPEFSRDAQNFDVTINYEQDEQAGAAQLREIFLKLAQRKQRISDSPTGDDKVISDAYDAIVEEFYPDWMNEVIQERLLPELSFSDVIKASQRMWDTYPAMDQDYDYDDQRVGPGVAYQPDEDEDEDEDSDDDEGDDSDVESSQETPEEYSETEYDSDYSGESLTVFMQRTS